MALPATTVSPVVPGPPFAGPVSPPPAGLGRRSSTASMRGEKTPRAPPPPRPGYDQTALGSLFGRKKPAYQLVDSPPPVHMSPPRHRSPSPPLPPMYPPCRSPSRCYSEPYAPRCYTPYERGHTPRPPSRNYDYHDYPRPPSPYCDDIGYRNYGRRSPPLPPPPPAPRSASPAFCYTDPPHNYGRSSTPHGGYGYGCYSPQRQLQNCRRVDPYPDYYDQYGHYRKDPPPDRDRDRDRDRDKDRDRDRDRDVMPRADDRNARDNRDKEETTKRGKWLYEEYSNNLRPPSQTDFIQHHQQQPHRGTRERPPQADYDDFYQYEYEGRVGRSPSPPPYDYSHYYHQADQHYHYPNGGHPPPPGSDQQQAPPPPPHPYSPSSGQRRSPSPPPPLPPQHHPRYDYDYDYRQYDERAADGYHPQHQQGEQYYVPHQQHRPNSQPPIPPSSPHQHNQPRQATPNSLGYNLPGDRTSPTPPVFNVPYPGYPNACGPPPPPTPEETLSRDQQRRTGGVDYGSPSKPSLPNSGNGRDPPHPYYNSYEKPPTHTAYANYNSSPQQWNEHHKNFSSNDWCWLYGSA